MAQRLRYISLPDELERFDFNERGDCTVVAIAQAAELPYREAHALLAQAGRRPKKGFTLRNWLACQCTKANTTGTPFRLGKYSVHAVPLPTEYRDGGYPIHSITLARFLRDFPKGRFILRKRGHAFAVVDGCVSNFYEGVRVRITNIWHLTEDKSWHTEASTQQSAS